MIGSECKESEVENEGVQGTYSDAMKTVMLSRGTFHFGVNFWTLNEMSYILSRRRNAHRG